MTVVKPDHTRKLLTTLLVLVLSVLACSQPLPDSSTTPVTTPTVSVETPDNSVVESADNTPIWRTTVARPVVNVRAKPDGPILDSLRAGASVEILECTKNWCRIKKPAGWVWRGCLSDNPAKLGCQAK